MKPALLVIDVQKAFFEGSPFKIQSLNQAIEYINYTINFFRQMNLPIISIQHMDEEDGLMPGTEGFDLPEGLDILETDIHINKKYGNAFNKTRLLEELNTLGVDTVFISGYRAENCVLSTCRGAEDLDLMPIIIRGSIASDSLEMIQFVEKINELISIDALEKMLE
ncbi:MAG: isochorismatase family protein [Anaerolineaceae bacterium]|nr:isochorismatase family protein [Anaerolineaceae bacterium]